LEDGEYITGEFLPADLTQLKMVAANSDTPNATRFVLPPEGVPLAAVELELARQAFERANGNLTHAAKLLDISHDQLRYKLKKDAG
jgi:DNA-binding NtrC family response regulator